MSLARSMSRLTLSTAMLVALAVVGCGGGTDGPGTDTGGAPGATGGKATGGAPATGGVSGTGGATGGAPATGGKATGGSEATGGATGGSSVTGGRGGGGPATGGASTTGGRGGAPGATGGSGTGTGGSTSPSGMSAGCGKMPTIPSSMYNNGMPIPIMAGGMQRRYILSVPTNYDNTKPYRLVIAWHQLDGNDKQMYQQNYYWIKDIAEAASSTIFVAPNGMKNNAPCTGTGVAESGCGWPEANGAQIALADAVVGQVMENFCVDPNKIFANGWSYGGSMTFHTACERPLGGKGTWGIRAAAVYNGAENLSNGNGCKASKPVAFYASHGTNDNVLPYTGGISMAKTYATQNGCTYMEPAKASGNHICTNMMGCMTGYPVEFCSFVGPHTPDPPREGGSRWQPGEVWKMWSQF